jgi:hypothetical protein
MSCSNASSLLGPQACCFIRRLGLECFFCMATYSCITRLGQASPSSFRDGIGDGQLLSAGWEISSTSLARNAQAVDKIVLIKDRAEPKTSKPCLSSYRDATSSAVEMAGTNLLRGVVPRRDLPPRSECPPALHSFPTYRGSLALPMHVSAVTEVLYRGITRDILAVQAL